MDKIKHYAVTIDSDVYAISLVDCPAIEEDFIFLSKQKEEQVFLEKEDKHLIVGAVLVPDKPIYRNNGKEEFYIQFSKETIEKLAHEYLMNGRIYSVTTDHQDIADDVALVESWIKTSENDKSNDYGMNLPIGTWLVSMKVENEDVWGRVKSGELRGFSIESFVNLDEINLQKQDKNMTEEKLEAIQVDDNFWDKLRSIISNALGKPQESEEVEKTVGEIVDEMEIEGGSEDEKPRVEEMAEEVAEAPVDEVAPMIDEIAKDVIEEVNEQAPTEEVKIKELEAVIDALKEEINKKDAMIEEMSKNIEKLSKQPSAEPVRVEASKQSQHPSFLDFASGRIKL